MCLLNIIMSQTKFVIYKTVNLVNGKFYIGKHKTSDLQDSYLGSGVALNCAIKKYGEKNFQKEILFVFDNEHDMNHKEIELITEDLINNPQCYNIALGGQGGNLGKLVNEKIGKKMSEILTGKPKSDAHKNALRKSNASYKPSEETKNKISNTISNTWSLMPELERKEKCGKSGKSNPFYGKTHSEESLEKMRETIGDSRKGSKNANAKPITLYGKTYATRKECLEDLNISKRQLYKILGEL